MPSDLHAAPAARARFPQRSLPWAAGALFLCILATRLWLIREWGSPVPIGDEWDSDASRLLGSWLNGTLRWSDFFEPHNEHRIALTRVTNLTLLIVLGHWSLWWEMIVSAVLHALCAVGLYGLFASVLPSSQRAGWWSGLLILFAATFGWQNALWGFQSQVYFCNVLTVLGVAGMVGGKPLSRRWWMGWLAALAALFSNASGPFVAMAVSATLLLQWPLGHLRGRRGLALALIGGIIAFAVALRVEVPGHASLRAQNLLQFSAAFTRAVGWPHIESSWLWLLTCAPVLWHFIAIIRRQARPDNADRCALTLALVAVLHAAAIAYSRGAGLLEARPLSRYQDPLLLGAAANLFLLLRHWTAQRPARLAGLAWAGVMLLGLIAITADNFSLHLPYKRMQDNANLAMVRAYLEHGDPDVFSADPRFQGPHPSVRSVVSVLDDPQLRRILPRELLEGSAPQPWPVRFVVPISLVAVALFFAALVSSRIRLRHHPCKR